MYLIFALGNICDDYFVPVLEIICETLNLSNDVAGATFMAAGMNDLSTDWPFHVIQRLFFFLILIFYLISSFYFNLGTSAPEFFTNIMGTFVTKSDLGIGTIVGR